MLSFLTYYYDVKSKAKIMNLQYNEPIDNYKSGILLTLFT